MAVGLSFDDEFPRGAFEPVHCGLGEEWVGHDREPFAGRPHHGCGAGSPLTPALRARGGAASSSVRHVSVQSTQVYTNTGIALRSGDPVTVEPPQPDSIDVNVFEVEFSNGLTLRVGYNHFPEGTLGQLRVSQKSGARANRFTRHQGCWQYQPFRDLPAWRQTRRARHQSRRRRRSFDWSINGVPFKYSVRRDPNC